MRHIFCFLFIILSILLFSCAHIPVQKAEEELLQMEANRSKAIAAHDTTTLDKMYADEFTGVTATGFTVDKATLMQVFKRDNPNTVFTNDQHKVQILGKDVAILTGRLVAKDKNGKILQQSLFMHVLVWRDKHWQIIRGQGTMLP